MLVPKTRFCHQHLWKPALNQCPNGRALAPPAGERLMGKVNGIKTVKEEIKKKGNVFVMTEKLWWMCGSKDDVQHRGVCLNRTRHHSVSFTENCWLVSGSWNSSLKTLREFKDFFCKEGHCSWHRDQKRRKHFFFKSTHFLDFQGIASKIEEFYFQNLIILKIGPWGKMLFK